MTIQLNEPYNRYTCIYCVVLIPQLHLFLFNVKYDDTTFDITVCTQMLI